MKIVTKKPIAVRIEEALIEHDSKNLKRSDIEYIELTEDEAVELYDSMRVCMSVIIFKTMGRADKIKSIGSSLYMCIKLKVVPNEP